MTIQWQPFVELVKRHESFVITSHVRPDCDAIGSELGLFHALRSMGKQVRIVNSDPVPPHIAFIDPAGDTEVLGRDIKAADIHPDVHFVLDTSAWVQLGAMAEVVRNSSAVKVVVDHHASQDDLGAEVFKDTTAESTGRLILNAIEALGVTVTPEIAVPLFAAIATDTGWFRFPSVTNETFEAVARLLRAGAQPTAAFRELYEQNSVARLRLQGRILNNVQTDVDGRLIYSLATPQDFIDTGAEATDTEDVVNRLLSVTGVEVGLLFLELEPQETKVSLRSRTSFDVCKIAEQFGGGGHKAAAGVRYPGPMKAAIAAVVDAVRKKLI